MTEISREFPLDWLREGGKEKDLYLATALSIWLIVVMMEGEERLKRVSHVLHTGSIQYNRKRGAELRRKRWSRGTKCIDLVSAKAVHSAFFFYFSFLPFFFRSVVSGIDFDSTATIKSFTISYLSNVWIAAKNKELVREEDCNFFSLPSVKRLYVWTFSPLLLHSGHGCFFDTTRLDVSAKRKLFIYIAFPSVPSCNVFGSSHVRVTLRKRRKVSLELSSHCREREEEWIKECCGVYFHLFPRLFVQRGALK